MLLTLIEHITKIKPSPLVSTTHPELLPSVTIIVPCYNEEKTVAKTIESLLALDYPTSKLFISIVDDGSKDNTWNYVARWNKHPQIHLHRKDNGGKYTALNYGIEHARTDLVGCLDADSFVEPDALRKIVYIFHEQPDIMAVAPAVKIWKPDSVIRSIQYVEYTYGIFIKKLFSLLNAVHVTPGPFSIFRRTMFQEIGYFKHAHNTEDMEIAMRMQKYGKKIANCHDAYVYTVGPHNLKTLHKQRLRWTYGFIKNAFDYRSLLLNYKVGNVGFITLPFSLIAIVGTVCSLALIAYNTSFRVYDHVHNFAWAGWKFNFSLPSLNTFYFPTQTISLISLSLFINTAIMIVLAIILTKQPVRIRDLAFYFTLYPFIALTWIIRSVYKVAFAQTTTWR